MSKRPAISASVRFDVLKRDRFTCQYCGAGAPDVVLHVDHKEPVAHGGKNHSQNLITACRDCNLGKGSGLLGVSSADRKAIGKIRWRFVPPGDGPKIRRRLEGWLEASSAPVSLMTLAASASTSWGAFADLYWDSVAEYWAALAAGDDQ